MATASPSILLVRETCEKYVGCHQWKKAKFEKLKQYNTIDSKGNIYHQSWISNFSRMNHQEHKTNDDRFNALIKCIFSRFH